MNKHCYRLIFSKKLGFLIPVAETTCAAAKPGQSRGASSPAPTRWLLKALPLALLGILPYTNAQIVIAPDHRAQIIQSANGVPVMEINNPNSNGLSHNRLNDFNVANPGIIFNNSMRDGTSQIGGHVMRNAKLTREARAILAEVTGNNASRIEGTLEVFGGRADLFIANPNGITLNGVNLYNASGLSVTTGQVVIGANGPKFRVDERSGRIRIGSEGINTQGLSYFDIVARAVELNGEIGSEAKNTNIKVVAGINTYFTDSRTHRKDEAKGRNTPVVAIDGTAAGAMHGSYITLISTESGAGVRHRGALHSSRDIAITAEGDVILSQLNADKDLNVRGRAVTIDAVKAGQNVSLDSEHALQINALNAGRNATLQSRDQIRAGDGAKGNGLNAGGVLDMKASGRIVINNDVSVNRFNAHADALLINASTVEAIGAQLSGTAKAINIVANDFRLSGQMQAFDEQFRLLGPDQPVVIRDGSIQTIIDSGRYSTDLSLNTTAMLKSGGGIDITVKHMHNDGGVIEDRSSRGIRINADTLLNQGIIQTQGELFVAAAKLDNLCFAGAALNNGNQRICGGLLAAGNADLKVGQLNTEGGLASNRTLSLQLGSGTHTIGKDGELSGTHALNITQGAGQQASLQNAGRIVTTQALGVAIDAMTNAEGSTLSATNDLKLQINKKLELGGTILSGQRLVINAQDVHTLSPSLIQAVKDVEIKAERNLTNDAGTTMLIGGDLLMTAGKDLFTGANIFVNGENATLIAAGQLTNARGSLISTVNLTLRSGGELTNEDASFIAVEKNLTLESANDLTNLTGSVITSGDVLNIKVGGTLKNDAEAMIEGGRVNIEAQHLVNSNSSMIFGYESLSIVTSGNVRNESGSIIEGFAQVSIDAGETIHNNNALLTAPDLILKGKNVINSNKGEMTAGHISVKADETFKSQSGATMLADTIEIDAHRFEASASNILATDDIQLRIRDFYNTATVHSKNTATVTMKDGSSLVIGAGQHNPTADKLLSIFTHNLTVNGALSNPGAVKVRATGYVRNNGEILSGKWLDIGAKGSIDNLANKLIWAAQSVVLNAGTTLTNWQNALIRATSDLTLTGGTSVINETGRIDAGRNIAIDTALLENRSELLGELKIDGTAHTQNWYTEAWGLWDTEYFRTEFWTARYNPEDLKVKQGVIQARGDLLINQGSAKGTKASVRNLGGLMGASGDMKIDGSLDNLGTAKHISLVDYLKNSQAYARWSVSESSYPDGPQLRTNMYDLFDSNLLAPNGNNPGQVIWGNNQWMMSLRLTDTPEGNALLSAVFGADWKSLDHPTMRARWLAFKAEPDRTMDFYADKQAELSAGGTFLHTGGLLNNGTGSNWGENRTVDVQIGDEKLTTIAGELDALFNRDSAFDLQGTDYLAALQEAINAANALQDLINGNPLFRPNFDLANAQSEIDRVSDRNSPDFKSVYPMYTSRVSYNPDAFYGSEYLFGKLGYSPEKTVTVLGDAYFDNELIVRRVESTVGNFFTVHHQLSGADLVQSMMDNAAREAAKLGLVIGQPLTQEQYERLEGDIVWYEPEVVNGITVLAPKVYLSKNTLTARQQDQNNGGLITATNVVIDATGVNNINGVIRGTNDTLVYSETDINNVSQGGSNTGIHGGDRGRLTVAAEGKVHNQGGNMQGFEQTVVGGQGVTNTATTRYDENGTLLVRENGILGAGKSEVAAADVPQQNQEQVDPQAQAPGPAGTVAQASPKDTKAEKPKLVVAKPDVRAIFEKAKADSAAGAVAADAVSSVTVISGGDINLIGATTSADKVTLQASGDVNMKDIQEVSSDFKSSTERGFLSFQETKETFANTASKGNQLEAGDLTITAGGNWNVTGSDVNADTSTVKVAGDTIVQAGKDASFYEKTQKTVQVVVGGAIGAVGYEVGGEASQFQTQQTASDGTESDLRPHEGGYTGATKYRGDTAGARARVGIEIVETKETKQATTHRNSQLNLGTGTMDVGGTFDLGGADINAGASLSASQRASMSPQELAAAEAAMPTLAITAGEIKSTKAQDTYSHTFEREETFLGYTAEAHSSALNVAGHIQRMADREAAGMEIDPVLAAAALAANATQLATSDALGGSYTLGMKHSKTSTTSNGTAENVNLIGGNISLTTTKGDIELNGVNIKGGKVSLDSAGEITQRGAISTANSSSESQIHSLGYTTSAAKGLNGGVGIGLSVGADGNYDKTNESSTSNTSTTISGTNVSIKSKGDHNIAGSTIKAGHLDINIGGNQNITSVQDVSNMDHTRGSWSTSSGIAVTTNGLIQGVASVSASGGADYDRSRLTAEQSGISAGSMNMHIGGDQNLTGAHIVNTSGQGSYRVEGSVNAKALEDSRDKDGGYVGVGAGIGKSGLTSVTVEAGRVDQVKYDATQKATIDLGGLEMSVGGSVNGDLNRDGNSLVDVTQDRHIAGTDVKVEISVSKDKKKKKKTPAPDADTPSKAKPDAPDAPDSPTTPAKKKPATPDTPDSPDTPPKKKPATPDTPSPTKPATPDAPSSTKPATPDTPSSTKPTTPDAPSSTKPATPDTPSSSKPATPDAPSTTKPAADTPDGTKPAADTASPTKPQTDSNARHMTVATTGGDLKKATTQLNSANSADQASLKNNPVPVTVRGADGKLTTHIVSDAASLKALNGMQVVTGEYAENVNRGSGMGQSSKLYIKVTPQPGGGFTTSFTSSPPKPLK